MQNILLKCHAKQDIEPIVFLKPTASLNLSAQTIFLPAFSTAVHHECEFVVLIGKDVENVTAERALEYIGAYGIGLDLTARDIQSLAKQQGLPWTKAKGFRQQLASQTSLWQVKWVIRKS